MKGNRTNGNSLYYKSVPRGHGFSRLPNTGRVNWLFALNELFKIS